MHYRTLSDDHTFVLLAICPAIKPISAAPNVVIQNDTSYVDISGFYHTGLQFIQVSASLKDQNGVVVDIKPAIPRPLPSNAAAGFDTVELNTAATIQVTQNKSYASIPLNYQPGVQNQYPENATAGQKITIITTVTSSSCAVECVTDYNEVIVNILLPKTSVTLSTAPASPAVNTVTAPATGGPWRLIVQVLWINYPTGGTIATFQTTMTIKIIGPSTISTVASQQHHHHGHHHR